MKSSVMDKLESFINQNREAFDDRIPRPELWERVQSEIKPSARRFRIGRSFWAIAAGILIVIMASGAIGYHFGGKNLSDPDPQIAELEVAREYYQGQVKTRLAKLARLDHNSMVVQDIQEMDVFIDELRRELDEAPPQEIPELVNAIIDNYQAKIDILETVLSKLEESREKTKTKEI